MATTAGNLLGGFYAGMHGTFSFHHHLLYLANVVVHQLIGLEETRNGGWSIWFNTVPLTTFHARDCSITG